MRTFFAKVMGVGLLCGGLAVSTIDARPAAAAPIIPAAPWKVTSVGAIPAQLIPIPNALPGVGFAAVFESVLKVDFNGDGDTNDAGLERIDPSTGTSIPFVGTVLDFATYDPTGRPLPLFVSSDLGEPVRGGLFVWAAERPGIDLDGDGATNHTGYFWASGSGTLRFVRAGKPYVPLYSSIIAAMYGHGDGVVIAESEADRKIDLDGNGTIDFDHYDIISLHSGGAATVEHVQTFGELSLTRLHDGSVGGSLFVRVDGSMRTFNPNARVVGHIGEIVYRNVMVNYMQLGPMLVDRPGAAPVEVAGRIVSQDEAAVWLELSEVALGRDLTGEGTIDPNTLATCRVVADGSNTCTAVAEYRQSPQLASTGPGYLLFYAGSTLPNPTTGVRLYLLGPSGLVGSYEGNSFSDLGDGTFAFAESTPPIGADVLYGAAIRIVRSGVVTAPVWSHRMVSQAPQIASLGDGRALVTIAEGVPNDLYGPPNPFAEDLNGNGRFGDGVTFLYANGAMSNLRVLADPTYYFFDFSRKVTRPNGPIFLSVLEGGSGLDLNGDGDTIDAVAHVVDGHSVTNLGLAMPHNGNIGGANFQVAGPDSVYTRVSEGEQGRDLDGNGTVDPEGFLYFLVSRMPSAPSHGFVTPARLLDTRPVGRVGYTGAKPTAGQTLDVQIAGQAGLPVSGVRAVALNVTIADATAPGFVTVWGEGDRPETSNLNVQTVGQTVPNMVIVPVGVDGKVRIYTDHGGHLLADVAAWWGEDSGLTPLTPSRLLDTRSVAKPAPGSVTTLHIAGRGGAPATGPMVAVLNVTLTAATEAGFVTVWGPGDRPATSNLNATRKDHTAANLVIVPVDANGDVHLYTDNGSHLIADLTGVFANGVTVIAPNRILDTRDTAKPNAGQTITVPVGVPAGTTVVLNVTATAATGPGFVTVWPDRDRPNASNLNIVTAGQTIPNLVIVPVGADGNIRLYTDAGTHLIIDHLATLS
jgi:hypothetical protein